MRTTLHYYNAVTGWAPPLEGSADSPHTLVLAFGNPNPSSIAHPLAELNALFPLSIIAGCSTAGEIIDANLHENGLALAVIRFERTRLLAESTQVISADHSRQAARVIAERLWGDDLRGVFLLSDGLSVNGSELVSGFNDVLPEHVVITGGLAGDNSRFENTWTLLNAEPRSHQIVAIGFYGDRFAMHFGSKGGWDIFGPERLVTRSSGNVLFELNGKPALELYKNYLGERAEGLPATGLLFPLAIREPNGHGEQVVRTILGVCEEDQSITFAGDIPEGAMAALMRANFDRLISGAAEAGEMLRPDGTSDGDLLSIAISCVGRRLVLGERTEEEIEATLDALPAGTRQIGFYSYGELSPIANGRCDLHNQTMTLTLIYEHL